METNVHGRMLLRLYSTSHSGRNQQQQQNKNRSKKGINAVSIILLLSSEFDVNTIQILFLFYFYFTFNLLLLFEIYKLNLLLLLFLDLLAWLQLINSKSKRWSGCSSEYQFTWNKYLANKSSVVLQPNFNKHTDHQFVFVLHWCIPFLSISSIRIF